jgi:hypothetical protein
VSVARIAVWCAVAATAPLALGSCSGQTSAKSSALLQIHPLTRSELTPAEIKYGATPRPNPAVTYQTDVVLVDGGAETIRSMGADGLTCTIDGLARHAREIAVGKIAFVSGRCAGRVLAITRDGDNLQLVLGPVELTDVFQELHVALTGPLDLGQALEYPAPRFAGTTYPLEDADHFPDPPPQPPVEYAWFEPRGGSAFITRPVAWSPFDEQQGLPVSPGIPQRIDPSFHVTEPLDKTFGPGIEVAHESNGLRMVAQFQVQLGKPDVDCFISVTGGRVDEARFIIKNSARLRIAFDAVASRDFSKDVSWYMPGLALDIPAGPTGISISFRQGIWLDTSIRARSSMFSAGGIYRLNANLGIRYEHGKLSPVVPDGLTIERNLFKNMSGVSVGKSGLRLGHTLSVIAGIGALGFTAGPGVDLHTQFQIGRGPTITIVQCRDVAVAVGVDGNLSWSIPGPIKDLVNAFLKLVNVRPIADHGQVLKTTTVWPYNRRVQSASPVCRN